MKPQPSPEELAFCALLEKRLAASTLAEKRAVEEEIADILRGKKSRDVFDAKLAQTGEQE